MKLSFVFLITFLMGTLSAYASNIACILEADGPDYKVESEFSYDVDEDKYFYEEAEVNEYIYSAMTFAVEENSVDIELILTNEGDYSAEDYFSLKLGKSKLIESTYFLGDIEYNYTLLCSFEK